MTETERLNHFESRFAWLERHVLEQDKAMLELNEELVRLRRECAALRARLGERDEGSPSQPTEERPPHY